MEKDFRAEIGALVENRKQAYTDMSDRIWGFAEPRFQEYDSSRLQQEYLKARGFSIRADLAGEETAFIAEYEMCIRDSPYTQALLSAIPIPDPEVEEKKQRIRLEGELPSPVDPPDGCRFINRCRFASERCRKERPELMEMEPGHLVACHYCEEMKKGTVG